MELPGPAKTSGMVYLMIENPFLIIITPGIREASTVPTLPSPSYITYMWVEECNRNQSSKQTYGDVEMSFLPNSLHTLTLHESRMLIENGATGFHTWSASFELVNNLLISPG